MAFQDIPKSLIDSVSSVLMNEKKGDKEEYQKFFQSALKKFGVESPAELKGDKEKEFYDYVDKNWKSDAEEKGVSEETIEEAKSEKPFISAMKDRSYAVNIDGIPNDFIKGGFNAQIKYNKDINDFKSSAKKVYVGAKGKDTVKAVQKWAKENPGVQFYASWKSDSSGYKDDSVELYIKEETITEGVMSRSEFDKLKRGDKITITWKGGMGGENSETFMVKGKTSKGDMEKVSLVGKGGPRGSASTSLISRKGGDPSFAIGNMTTRMTKVVMEETEDITEAKMSGDYAEVIYDYSEDFYMIVVYKNGKKVAKDDGYLGSNSSADALVKKFKDVVKKARLNPEGLPIVDDEGTKGVFKNNDFKWGVREETEDITEAKMSGDYAEVIYNYSEDFYLIVVYKNGKKVVKDSGYFGPNAKGDALIKKFKDVVKKARLNPEGLAIVDDEGTKGVFKNNDFKWGVKENVSMKIMKAVKSADSVGPWSVVAIQNKKVVDQELVKVRDQLPATFKVMKKKFPMAYISIEDDQINKRLFVEEVKYPHMMYDPESGKGVEVKDEEEHNKYAEKGWTHEKPKMDEAKDEYVIYMDSKKKVKKEKIVRTSNDELILGNGDTVDILDMVDTEKKIKTKGDWTMAEWVSEEDADVVLESKFYKPQVNKSQESIVFMNDAEAKEAERYLGKKGIKVTRKAKKVTFDSSDDFQDAVSMVTESAEPLTEGVDDPGIFKAIFLAGGPGSGKSYVVKKSGIIALGFKILNSDSHFERALEAAGKLDDPIDIDDPEVIKLRQGAKALTKKQQIMWLEGRLGLVIDGTGKDFKKVSGQVDKLKELGYDVAMIFVNTDLETARERNKMRRRSLPDHLVEPAWKEVQNNIGKFQNLFGQNFMVADNSEGAPTDKILLQAFKKFMRWAQTPPKSPIAKQWIQKQMGMREAKKLQEATATIKLDRGSSMEISSIVKNVADRLERQVSKNSGKPGLVRDKLYDALIGELMDRKLKFTNVNEETIFEAGEMGEGPWVVMAYVKHPKPFAVVGTRDGKMTISVEKESDVPEVIKAIRDTYKKTTSKVIKIEVIDTSSKKVVHTESKELEEDWTQYDEDVFAEELEMIEELIEQGLTEEESIDLVTSQISEEVDSDEDDDDDEDYEDGYDDGYKDGYEDAEEDDEEIDEKRMSQAAKRKAAIYRKKNKVKLARYRKIRARKLKSGAIKVKKSKSRAIKKARRKPGISEDYDMLSEPAVSQSQQALMGMALAYKRGEMPESEASDKVKELAKSMSEKDLEDFAKTKHDDLPKKA